MVKKAWVVSADMGYGHQRAAYPLKDIAYMRIINANSDKLISDDEKKIWNKARLFYEWISKVGQWPILGGKIFNFYNKIQKIDAYYPRIPKSEATYQVNYLEKEIKNGLGKSLINYVKRKKLPFVTTFYIPAIAANYSKIPNIYCVITDTDINRIWVPKDPKKSTITYFAPCQHAVNRLQSYGIQSNQIILTGFPLPKECTGKDSEITRDSLSKRLVKLDPKRLFLNPHLESIKPILGKYSPNIKKKSVDPLTITFVVGGAGAQKEIGVDIMKSLKNKILEKKIRLVLVAGTHLDIKQYFEDQAENLGLKKCSPKNLYILAEITKKDYFSEFNKVLNYTDVLWTKPSELSFYSALGLPIIMAPEIGAQELWNRKWLLEIGAGIDQEDPQFVSEWIEEWLQDGRLARKAWEGYLNAPRMGTYEIEKHLFNKTVSNK